ncbi:MAG: PKD domain-containing protein [Acidobacteriota bacterium]
MGYRPLAAGLIARSSTYAVILGMTVACTVHQGNQAPPLAGPSTFAQSIAVTANPDLISQDGASQSAINVRVFDVNGQPMSAIPLRIDIVVNGTLVDYGTLSTKTIVTGLDGRATTVYTAPPPPPPTAQTASTVTIRVTAVGTDAPSSGPFSATIRLVPPGVIRPPADTPTAAFTVSPTTPVANIPVQFNASGSCGGPLVGTACQSASQITSYSWTFGDAVSGSGQTISHTYAVANSYNVTLTVTNDRGVSASTTQALAVGSASLPTPVFTFSPTKPGNNAPVFFSAAASTAGAGHQITSYQWSFGDGTSGSGQTASHAYSNPTVAPVTYRATLTVTDEVGQTVTSAPQDITVGP